MKYKRLTVIDTRLSAPELFGVKLRELLRKKKIPADFWVWDRTQQCYPDQEKETTKILFRGGGEAKKRLIFYYPHWMLKIFLASLQAGKETRFFCTRFDAALPVALGSLLRKRRYVFADIDTFLLSHDWPVVLRKWITIGEQFVIDNAEIYLIPGRSRLLHHAENPRIVPNTPTSATITQANVMAEKRKYTKGEVFTLYVNGWLVPRRGMPILLKALEDFPQDKIRLIVAGTLNCQETRDLVKLPFTEYLGEVDPVEALASYRRAHLVFCYYDPLVTINRKAEPNKWYDCIIMETPFLTNDEVETAEKYRRKGACLSLPYSDWRGLRKLLLELAENPKSLEKARTALKEFSIEPWDVEMSALLDEFLADSN